MERDSEVRTLTETDARNFDVVYKCLGPAATLPDDVAKVYTMHYTAIAPHLPDLPAQIAGALYMACKKHLVLGATSLFRRYASQAFRETRCAVEAAGIAHAIRVDPQNYRVFREDKGSGESRKAARARFTSGRLFPPDIPELAALKSCYDRASELSHSNRRTFVPHLHLSEGMFSYQDIQQKDIPRLITNYLIWLCFAHLAILEAAEIVFKDVNCDLEQIQNERQYVGKKLVRFDNQNEGRVVEDVAQV